MNTRLEIDTELATRLEAAAKARGVTLKDFVADVLKETVNQDPPTAPPAPYVLKTYDLGGHIESPWTVLADLEVQEYSRTTSKK